MLALLTILSVVCVVINATIIPKTISDPVTVNRQYLSDQDCSCGGGTISLYGYEVIPLDGNTGCVGGCGGNGFSVHNFATSVKTLRVWTGGDHNGFRAMDIELFDGTARTLGSPPARGPDSQITFSPGEYIVGDMELCGNGVGSRTGYLAFTTSLNQKFSVGDQHTPYYFPSGNSFLVGFFGQSSDEIDHLGFYMMKPITEAQMLNISYPTLNTYGQGLSPQIYKTVMCNDDHSQSQVQTATFTKETGISYSWSLTLSFTFGGSISVTAGLPEVAQVTEEFHWEVGISSTYQQSFTNTKTETMDYPTTVPPRERIYSTFTWWDSTCDVPYTANLVYNFRDGSNYVFHVSGTYTGAYITTSQSNYHHVPLGPTESC
jgi:hypothetical protein